MSVANGLSLGTRIKRARGRAGVIRGGEPMSQEELARAIGKSRSAVNSYENDRTTPREDVVAAMEAVLGVTLREEPEVIEPRDDFEREVLARQDSFPPGWAEQTIELYRKTQAGATRAG